MAGELSLITCLARRRLESLSFTLRSFANHILQTRAYSRMSLAYLANNGLTAFIDHLLGQTKARELQLTIAQLCKHKFAQKSLQQTELLGNEFGENINFKELLGEETEEHITNPKLAKEEMAENLTIPQLHRKEIEKTLVIPQLELTKTQGGENETLSTTISRRPKCESTCTRASSSLLTTILLSIFMSILIVSSFLSNNFPYSFIMDNFMKKSFGEKELAEHPNFHKWLRELENACKYKGKFSILQLQACHKVRHHLNLQKRDRKETNLDNELAKNFEHENFENMIFKKKFVRLLLERHFALAASFQLLAHKAWKKFRGAYFEIIFYKMMRDKELRHQLRREQLDCKDFWSASFKAFCLSNFDDSSFAANSFKEETFKEESFEESSLEQSSFEESSLEQSNFEESNLEQSSFEESGLEECSFEESSFEENSFEDSSFEENNFEQNSLEESSLEESRLEKSSLEESSLTPNSFEDSSLAEETFSNTSFDNTSFQENSFRDNNFREDSLADKNFQRTASTTELAQLQRRTSSTEVAELQRPTLHTELSELEQTALKKAALRHLCFRERRASEELSAPSFLTSWAQGGVLSILPLSFRLASTLWFKTCCVGFPEKSLRSSELSRSLIGNQSQ